MKKALKILVIILAVVGLVWLALRFNPFKSSDSQIESRVRSVAFVPDGEKMLNTLLINSPEALNEVKNGVAGTQLRDAEVGDYYVAFEGRGVLYRPSSSKVVSIIFVNSDNSGEEQKNQQTQNSETQNAEDNQNSETTQDDSDN